MAGDHVVRSLLETMIRSASSAYLVILERYFLTSDRLQELVKYGVFYNIRPYN